MKATKHLVFDYNGLKVNHNAKIANYYNSFGKLDLLNLESILFKLYPESILPVEWKNLKEDFLERIHNNSLKISFLKIEPSKLDSQLRLVESKMPEILSFLALYTLNGNHSIADAIVELKRNNPLNFDLSKGHPFYEYKIKKLLYSLCLTNLINKNNGYTNGISYVNRDGEFICCHISNERDFEAFLLKNTIIENKRYLEDVYEENGELYIKLNLQIRFK